MHLNHIVSDTLVTYTNKHPLTISTSCDKIYEVTTKDISTSINARMLKFCTHKCPVLSTLDNPRNSSYPLNKQQQHFINSQKLKYQVILGINLARHLLRDKIGTTKMAAQKSLTSMTKTHELIYTKVSKIVFRLSQTLNIFGQVEFRAYFRVTKQCFLICWQPVTVNSILITRWLCTVCRTASDTHFHFFTIFLLSVQCTA